jgi:hypothetical protein
MQLVFKKISYVCLFLSFFVFQHVNGQTSRKFSVYFDVNQSKIKPNDYKTLDSVVALIKKQPIIRRIQISGYADTTGDAEANQILSDNRTDTVSGYILSKGLQAYKKLITTASLGDNNTDKTLTLEEQRRVDIVLFFPKPDRDTVIRVGCIAAYIKANTFDNFNNNELTFKIDYIGTIEDIKKYKIQFKDQDGKQILSNGAVRLVAMFKNKPVKSIKPITIELPLINEQMNYVVYKGVEDKAKNITFKATTDRVLNVGTKAGQNGEDCNVQSFQTNDVNTMLCAGMPKPACYCSAEPFGGVLPPKANDELLKLGASKGGFLLNDGCFKKLDPSKANIEVLDNLKPEEYLNFCNVFLYPGVGNVPQVPKHTREVLRFIDINMPQNKEDIDQLMVKKNTVLLMIPKSQIKYQKDKKYAIIPAETRMDNYLTWNKKVIYADTCKGLINCDYLTFDVPFTGFYTLVELTPSGSKSKAKTESEDEEEPVVASGKNIKIKAKKFNNVMVVYGEKENNQTESAKFIANKGKHSILEPNIAKKDRKNYKQHVFLCYVLKDGKRYAWMGYGSELKKSFFSGNWKSPKLQYVPDEEWESFVKKFCE